MNSIYRVTDFDQDGRADNISFLIKRIKVHTTDALKDNEYRFPANYGVERFLELFSEEDYDQVSLIDLNYPLNKFKIRLQMQYSTH